MGKVFKHQLFFSEFKLLNRLLNSDKKNILLLRIFETNLGKISEEKVRTQIICLHEALMLFHMNQYQKLK